jgi:hypothetical protein
LAGPVVAVAIESNDPSTRAAAGIAIAAREDLVVVHAHEGESDDPGVRRLAADTGLTIKHVSAGKASLSQASPDDCGRVALPNPARGSLRIPATSTESIPGRPEQGATGYPTSSPVEKRDMARGDGE